MTLLQGNPSHIQAQCPHGPKLLNPFTLTLVIEDSTLGPHKPQKLQIPEAPRHRATRHARRLPPDN